MKTGGLHHLKTKRLKMALGIPLYRAVGLLETLWLTVGECAWEFGDIGRFDDIEIAAAIEWEGEPGTLIQALIDSHFLDPHPRFRLVVHGWYEHCPGYVRKRIDRKWGGDPLEIKDLDSVLDASGSQRLPVGANGSHGENQDPNGRLTQPNPTQPNPTKREEDLVSSSNPEGLKDLCIWWNKLYQEHLVQSGVQVSKPNEGVRRGWKRVKNHPDQLAILRDRLPEVEDQIRQSSFCREPWFRLEKLLASRNRSGEFILNVLISGGYRGSNRGSGRLDFSGLQGDL